MSEGYPRVRRITLRSDLERVYKEGTRIRTEEVDVRYVASPLGYSRVGIIVPLYKHSAVQRNKLKRRLREGVRQRFLGLPLTQDVVIRAREVAYLRSFQVLEARIEAIGSTLLLYGQSLGRE